MRRYLGGPIDIAAILFVVVICGWSFVSATSANMLSPIVDFGGPRSTGCSQATTFLARTSGLSGTETTTYKNLICGMVSDGTWSLMDVFYWYATNNGTTAALNLVSTSFNGTFNNCTIPGANFTADTGITGGSNCFMHTNWVPSTNAVNYTLNSASTGTCVINSRSVSQTYAEYGAQNNSTFWNYLQPYNAGDVGFDINSTNTFPGQTSANAQGDWVINRVNSTQETVYQNAISLGTSADVSSLLSSVEYYTMAANNNGSLADQSLDTIAYFFAGAGLTPTQITNLRSEFNTALTALGNSGC